MTVIGAGLPPFSFILSERGQGGLFQARVAFPPSVCCSLWGRVPCACPVLGDGPGLLAPSCAEQNWEVGWEGPRLPPTQWTLLAGPQHLAEVP